MFTHCPSPPRQLLSQWPLHPRFVARCWPQSRRPPPKAARSPAMSSPSGWGLPLEQPYSAVGHLKKGSVPDHVAGMLEVASHPDSLSPHSGTLAVREALVGLLLGVMCLDWAPN